MNKILVPIDFSSATPPLLRFAGELATSVGAEIILVHVKEVIPAMPPSTLGYGLAGMPELMPTSPLPIAPPIPEAVASTEQENAKLMECRNQIQGVPVSVHEATGDIVEEILRAAETTGSDLIVMGRHGHGAMYNLLVGSVSAGVLKGSQRPVLFLPVIAERPTA